MNITGTNSYIILDINGWKVKVEGEMAVGKFYAEKNTMVNFEPPHETIPLTDDIKKKFIDEAIKKTANSHLIIYFV